MLDKTPFYAESGGQVGDKGRLTVGGEHLNVFDTKKENNEIIHFVERLPKDVNGEVAAQVDENLRGETLKNHSATHLLHLALRHTLGTHVEQKGSLVAPDRLRFDFSHFEKVTDEQIHGIEVQVRELISKDLAADIREMPIAEAKELGAMALFGEKYGDQVRVVQFGPSIELCGGTHVHRSSEIGGFALLSESSIASGIRRIEALTGKAYQTYVDERLGQLDAIEAELGHPKDSVASVAKLQADLKKANKLLEELADREKGQFKKDLAAKVSRSGGISAVISLVTDMEGKAVKDAVYGLTLEHSDLLAIVVGEFEDKPYIVVGVSKELVNTIGMDASKLIRELAVHIDGGGGGQKFLAMAGGKNKEGLRRALAHADDIVKDQAS